MTSLRSSWRIHFDPGLDTFQGSTADAVQSVSPSCDSWLPLFYGLLAMPAARIISPSQAKASQLSCWRGLSRIVACHGIAWLARRPEAPEPPHVSVPTVPLGGLGRRKSELGVKEGCSPQRGTLPVTIRAMGQYWYHATPVRTCIIKQTSTQTVRWTLLHPFPIRLGRTLLAKVSARLHTNVITHLLFLSHSLKRSARSID